MQLGATLPIFKNLKLSSDDDKEFLRKNLSKDLHQVISENMDIDGGLPTDDVSITPTYEIDIHGNRIPRTPTPIESENLRRLVYGENKPRLDLDKIIKPMGSDIPLQDKEVETLRSKMEESTAPKEREVIGTRGMLGEPVYAPERDMVITKDAPDIGESARKAVQDGKTVDEFVKGIDKAKADVGGKTYYHGGEKLSEIKMGKGKFDKTFYITDDRSYAKSFGGKDSVVNEVKLSPDAKLADLSKPSEALMSEIEGAIAKEVAKPAKYGEGFSFHPYSTKDVLQGIREGKAHFAELPQIKSILKKLGYDGQITSEVPYAKNIGVWNKKVVELSNDKAKADVGGKK